MQALAITLIAKAKDTERFRKILFDIGGNDMFVYQLPKKQLEELWNFNDNGERYSKFYAAGNPRPWPGTDRRGRLAYRAGLRLGRNTHRQPGLTEEAVLCSR